MSPFSILRRYGVYVSPDFMRTNWCNIVGSDHFHLNVTYQESYIYVSYYVSHIIIHRIYKSDVPSA